MAAKKTKKKTVTKARKPRTIRVTGAESTAPPQGRSALSKLSVPELQAMYREVVGRDTGSDDPAYLKWKIRQAKNGKVPVGPARPRIDGPAQVLALRLAAAAVPLLDEAWRKHGLRSRNELVLRALRRELDALGEQDAAAHFPEATAQ